MNQILVKNIRTQGGVVAICAYSKTVAMLDNMAHLYYISDDTFEFINSIIIYNNDKIHHKYCKIPSFCKSKRRFAYTQKDSKELTIYKHNGAKIEDEQVLKWHTQNLEASCFCSSGKFLVSGGADGRSFLFETTRFRPIITFKRRPDYIHLTLFSDDAHFLAIASFDKTISIYNINRHILYGLFQLDEVVETMLFANNILFFASRDQKFGTFDIDTKKIVIAQESISFWATTCALIPDSNYIALAGRCEYLIIISLDTMQITKKMTLNRACGVSSLTFIQDNLFISFIDGVTEIFNYNKHKKEMLMCLEIKDFVSVSQFCLDNPFLYLDKNYEEVLEKEWEKLLSKIIILIANNKIEIAFKIAQPFLQHSKRKAQFDFYILKRTDGIEFLNAISNKDFVKAYSMAQNSSYLQKLDAYIIMEDDWIKTYAKARRLLEADAHKNRYIARDLLLPYSKVESKKDSIAAILVHYGKFKEAENSVRVQDFRQYFAYCLTYQFLRETELYQKVRTLGETLFEKAIKQEHDEQYDEAMQTLETLKTFPQFIKIANERHGVILTKKLFNEAVKQNSINLIYSYAESNKEITQLPKFMEIETKIQRLLDSALQVAFDGDEKKLYSMLSVLENVPYWANNVKTLKRIAAITNLKKDILSMQRNAAMNAIKMCFDRYGADVELEQVCTENGFSDLYQQLNNADAKSSD